MKKLLLIFFGLILSIGLIAQSQIVTGRLEYASDYSEASTDRTLMDKEQVTSMIDASGAADVTGIRDTLNILMPWYESAIPIDTVARLKSDITNVYQFTEGFAEAIDTAIATTGAVHGYQLLYVPDSVVFTECVVSADSIGTLGGRSSGSVPSFTFQGYFTTSKAIAGQAIFGAGTTAAVQSSTSTVITTGTSITSFTEAGQVMPPGKYWIYFKTPTITNKFSQLNITMLGYYLNAD